MLQEEQPGWVEAAYQEAWEKAQAQIKAKKAYIGFQNYQDDPVGFGQDVLGDSYTEDMVKIAKSVRDNPITIARSATDTGKTYMASRLAIWFFSVFPDSKVYLTAAPPLENLKQILWGEINAVTKDRPTVFTGCKQKALSVYRGPRNFIQGVAIPTSGTPAEREAKFSGKHAPYLFFIVDEGDAVPDEIYAGIEGCMSGGSLVRLLIMFNPRAQVGSVYMREKNRQANVIELSAFNHPNVISGENLIPGAVTRGTTVRRINMWTRPLALDEKEGADTFRVPEFLAGETAKGLDGKEFPPLPKDPRKIIDPAFSYMVLGQYPSQAANQLISESWIDNAVTRWQAYVAQYGEIPPADIQPIMSLDVAEYGGDYSVAWFRYGGFVSRPTLWQSTDPDESASRGLRLYKQHNAQIIMVDGTGVGAGIAPSIARQGRKDDVRAISVKVSEKPSPVYKNERGDFKILRDQMFWMLRDWLEKDPGAMIPNDGLLREELLALSYEIPNGKIMITKKEELRKLLKRSPDRADALALTFAPFERAKWVRVGDRIEHYRNLREQQQTAEPIVQQNDAANEPEPQDNVFATWYVK